MKTIHGILGIALVTATVGLGLARAEMLLTPSVLHSLAQWNGTHQGGSGLLYPAEMIALGDNNPTTVWTSVGYTKPQPAPTLTSPAPFVVTRVQVVASTVDPARSAGTIEILPVGQGTYINTGIAVPSNLTAGQTWTVNLPAQYQIPISGIRHNGGHWVEMAELQFYGAPLGAGTIDITNLSGSILRTAPGSESPAGSLRNGVLEDSTDGYYAPNGNHRLVVDFGALTGVTYVAFNANAYWKFPLQAVGSTTPVNMNALTTYGASVTSSYSGTGGQDQAGHSWVVMPVNNGSALNLYGAGFWINNYWGDVSEIAILVPEPASAALLALAAGAFLRRRRHG